MFKNAGCWYDMSGYEGSLISSPPVVGGAAMEDIWIWREKSHVEAVCYKRGTGEAVKVNFMLNL